VINSGWWWRCCITLMTFIRHQMLAIVFNFCSLTHCWAWPAEGRSILHIERSWPAIQAAPTDRPMSSSTCCSQFLRGRPSGRFQSVVARGVPVWASIDSCNACKAGVFSGRQQKWPNNEWRLSAIRDGTSGDYCVGYLVIPSDTKDTTQCLHVKRLDPVTVYFAYCPRFRAI